MNSKELTYRKRLNTEYLIGCYHEDNGKAYFVDIRGKAGQRVQRPDGSPIESTRWFSPVPGLIDGEYYQFAWGVAETVEDYEFICKGNVQPLNKKELLDTRLNSKLSQSDENRQDELQHQEMINREVTGAPHTYIYELLQNANDYPQRDSNGNKMSVSVRFILTDNYLFFAHSGDKFKLPNIVAICTVNEGDKRAKTDTIGYKGMGFKSVFVKNDYAYLQSGDWSLRFDYKHIKSLDEFEMPWQYMPIYTDLSELDDEVRSTLASLGDDMLVKFALRHKTDASENEPNLKTVFSDERILIFIPYVDDVSVYINGQESYHVVKDRKRWLIEHQDFPVSQEYKAILDESLKNDNKIPEKFRKIENIRISFAIRRDGKILMPVEDAKVYNYLPTEESLSLPFLLNADFVPNASRNGLPLIEWNKRLLYEAGQRYARWWASFMSEEGEYDLNSVFSLLPDFQRGNELRNAFLDGLTAELENIPCIPVSYNNQYRVVRLNEIVIDSRGIVSDAKPVMSDELFYELTSYDKQGIYLPHPNIRLNDKLKSLLTKFSSHIGKTMSKDDYVLLSRSGRLLSWLKESVDNAIKYYEFLFRSSLMQYQLDCNDNIFLTQSNLISPPHQLYFNIDEALDRIYMFDDLLHRLNSKVRESLKSQFLSIQNKFKYFSPVDVANKLTADFDSNKYSSRIKTKRDSICFLSFLSTAQDHGRGYSNGIPSTFPLYLEGGSIHAGTSDIYIKDDFGISLSLQPWMEDEWVHFIDPEYVSVNNAYLSAFMRANGVTEISHHIAWANIISEECRIDHIIKSIEDKDVNIGFYRFLKAIEKEVVLTNDLKSKLFVFVNDGSYNAIAPLSTQIYWQDEQWETFLKESWLPAQCCWAMDQEYISNLPEDEKESMRRFFTSKFITNKFSISDFFNKCLKEYWKVIVSNIKDRETSRDLLKFLFTHRTEISSSFKRELYEEIPLFYKNEGDECLSIDDLDPSEIVYQPSEDIDILCDEPWFDSSLLTVLDDIYAPLFDSKDSREFFDAVGLRTFELITYLKDNVIDVLEDYNDSLNERSANIAFHNYMESIYKKLSKEDLEKLKKAPIYISSSESDKGELCQSSEDHYLPTELLSNVINQDIVPKKLLDSIHPDYCGSDESKAYFLELGNCELAEDNFLNYLSQHKSEVANYINSDKARNIRFWRWIVDFSAPESEMSKLSELPLLSSTDQNVTDYKNLYISDGFTRSKDLVELITTFITNPSFVSEDYLEKDKDRNWHPLLKALGVNVTARHIVLNKLVPMLDSHKHKNVLFYLANYANAIIKWVDDGDELRLKQLEDLHLLCQDGKIRKIKETLLSGTYVGLSNSFYPDITIGNLVSETYIEDCKNNETLKDNVIKLLVKLAGRFNKLRKDAKAFRNAKIKYFIDNQNLFSKTDIHCRIIAELAEDFKKDGDDDTFKKLFLEKDILLLNTNGERKSSKQLYLSTIYHPKCDFMSHDVVSPWFVSELYAEYGDSKTIKKFFILQLGIRQDFSENTLEYLTIESFSRYFWEQFVPEANRFEHFPQYTSLLVPDNLRSMKCIPTKLGMQTPRLLYDSRISKLAKMVTAIGKGDQLLPDITIPEGYFIGMKGVLDFDDCLEYLKTNNPAYRDDVYDTIVALSRNHPEILNSFIKQNCVTRFREEAQWYSGAKKWVPLKGLVALEWAEGHSLLKDHFGGSEHVVSKMPKGKDEYNILCSVLQIPIITNDDFDHTYDEESKPDHIAVQEINKRLLYLVYKHFGEEWKEKYIEIQKELGRADIRKCKSISYFCTGTVTLSTTLLSYSDTENTGTLWYVGNWNGAVFGDVLEWVVKKFTFLKAFDFGFLKNCFFYDFKTFLMEHEGGKLPSDFLDYLTEQDKTGLSVDEYDENQIDEDVEQDQTHLIDTSEDEISVGSEQGDDTNDTPVYDDEIEENEDEDDVIDEEDASDDVTYGDDNGLTEKKGHGMGHAQTPNAHKGSSTKDIPEDTSTESDEDKFREESYERWESDARKQPSAPTSAQPLVKADNGEGYNPDETPKTDAEYGSAYDDKARPLDNPSSPKAPRENSDKELRQAKEEERKAREKMSRRELLNKVPKYSLEWFNYRLDICLEDQKSYAGRNITLDFHDWCLIDPENGIYRLVSPDGYIPMSFADYNNQVVKVIFNGKVWQVDAKVIEADDSGIDLLCKTQLGTPVEGKRIQISATSNGNITQHLVSRFRRLSDQYNMATDLRYVLPENISFIYGPPGTGKTYEVVKRISNLFKNNAKIKILVLAPTNRAADEVAERLANDIFVKERLSRYGVTESRLLAENHYDKLKNRHNMDISTNKVLMVTTIARYPYDTVRIGQYSESIFDVDWDYIIVDEASMIDVIDISLLLLNNKAKNFIIAGDPNQIKPITPFDIEQCNIYDMVGIKSFSDAINHKTRYPVDALDVQYRSVPQIGKMVSEFSYQGLLKTDPKRAPQKPLRLKGINVDTINTIGFNVEMMSYLYGWNKVDDSPVHVYSAIFAYEFSGYIAHEIAKNHPSAKYTIGIVTPYGKQKEAIKQLLEQKPVGTANCEIKCGTAHSFQGGECDIMIVVMNYPDIYSSDMAHINNQNIMNVAISRARDYIFFLWPEVKEEHRNRKNSDRLPYIMNQRIGRLMPHGFKQLHAFDIEEIMFGDKTYIAKNSGTRCHMPVNISSPSMKRYDIRLSDTALDILIND